MCDTIKRNMNNSLNEISMCALVSEKVKGSGRLNLVLHKEGTVFGFSNEGTIGTPPLFWSTSNSQYQWPSYRIPILVIEV
jgi:hypothetical protein